MTPPFLSRILLLVLFNNECVRTLVVFKHMPVSYFILFLGCLVMKLERFSLPGSKRLRAAARRQTTSTGMEISRELR